MRRLPILTVLFLWTAWGVAPARADWMDALLPANHILEKLPLVDESGKSLSPGLFTFEDLNQDGRKDVLVAHREAVSADKLDQPHPQSLAVCFFDPSKKTYVEVLKDEGGPLKWVKILADPQGTRRFLVLEREDWQAETSLRVYTLGAPGKMDRVLETQSPWSYANVVVREGRVEALYSSKGKPAVSGQAESVFAWKESARQFVDPSGVPFSRVALLKEPTPAPVVAAAPPTKTPMPPAAEAKPKPAVKSKASVATSLPVASAEIQAPSANSVPSAVAGAWWGPTFSAPDAYAKLTGDLIPRRVKSGQLTPLGQEAKAFFEQLHAAGIKGTEFSDYRAGYLTGVATELYGVGDKTRGAYYLDLVLKYRPDFPKALELKTKVGTP